MSVSISVDTQTKSMIIINIINLNPNPKFEQFIAGLTGGWYAPLYHINRLSAKHFAELYVNIS